MKVEGFQPRVETLTDISVMGCRFAIENPTEHFRTVRYGGELEFTRMVVAAMQPSDVLYDIGANVGMISIHAASRGGSVYAFEPDPHFASRLSKNIELNQLRNIQVIPLAIGSEQGVTELYTNGDGGDSPCMRPVEHQKINRVGMEALDGMLERRELPAPTLMKMDIEGAELLALQGMARLLASTSAPRAIFIEIHPNLLELFDASQKDIFDFLNATGYRCAYQCRRHDQIHAVFWRRGRLGEDRTQEVWSGAGNLAWDERVLGELWVYALYLQVSPSAMEVLQKHFDGCSEDALCALLTISARGEGRLLAVGKFEYSKVRAWSELAGRGIDCVPELLPQGGWSQAQETKKFKELFGVEPVADNRPLRQFAVVFVDAKQVAKGSRFEPMLTILVERIIEKGLLVLTDYRSGECAPLDKALTAMSQIQGPLKPIGSSWRISAFRRIESPLHGAIFADSIVVLPGQSG